MVKLADTQSISGDQDSEGDPLFPPFTPTSQGASMSKQEISEILDKVNKSQGKSPVSEPKPALPQRKLIVLLPREYNHMLITFGIEEIFTIHSDLEEQAIFDQLTARLVNQHQHFINDVAPRMPRFFTDGAKGASPKIDQNTGEKSGGLQRYTADRLIKTKSKSGKTQYKIITTSGRFNQYGIVIFPERLKGEGLLAELGDSDFINLKNLTIEVDESGEYPVLVRLIGGKVEPF